MTIGANEAALLAYLARGTVQEFFASTVDHEYFIGEHLEIFNRIKDHVTKYKALPTKQTLVSFGDMGDYISKLIPDEPIQFYKHNVIDRRKFAKSNQSLKAIVEAFQQKDFETVKNLSMEMVTNLTLLDRKDIGYTTSNQALSVYAQYVKKTLLGGGALTGYPAIDCNIPSIREGELHCTVGRPGSGKSFVLQKMAHHCSTVQDKKALFVSCEMDSELMQFRHLAIDLGINVQQINAQELTTNLIGKIQKKAAANHKPITFAGVETARKVSIDSLRSDVHTYQPDVLFVDAAYLMEFKSKGHDPEWVRLGTMVNQLKDLAVECQIPIFAAYQENRESTKRGKGNKVSTAHIGGSDEIGRVASFVMHIAEDRDTTEDGDELLTKEIYVSKNRNGIDKYSFKVNWDFDKSNFTQAVVN